MILKVANGLSKKQKFLLVGFTILTVLSLTVSYIINQNNKASNASIIISTSSSISSISNSSLSSSSISSPSSSSSLISSSSVSTSSTSELPKVPEEKLKEVANPEPIIQKITTQDPVVFVPPTPKPIIQKPVYTPPVVVETPKPEPIVEQPKPVEVTSPPAPKPTLSFSSSSCNQSMVYDLLSLLNNHRMANGLGTLTLAGDLNGVACSHAQWMSETGNFSHTGKDGTNPYQRCERAGTVCWAENVAYDTEVTAVNIFELYKNSPGHNKNMLNPEYTEVGLAFAGIYNAQEFR
jgi:uncharacterized protein YkwD